MDCVRSNVQIHVINAAVSLNPLDIARYFLWSSFILEGKGDTPMAVCLIWSQSPVQAHK